MRIAAIQKVTLVDYPGVIAATLFLPGCDLRCGFCHNPDLVFNKNIDKYITPAQALAEFAQLRRFVEGICITGGEPLLSLDIDFVRELKEMGFKVKLDTNGFHPDKLKQLLDEKLIDYVAIDIKTLPLEYRKLTGCKGDVDALIESVRLAATLPQHEFRTTIIPGFHTPQLVRQMIDWLVFVTQRHNPDNKLYSYSLQQFVPRTGKMISGEFDTIAIASTQLLEQCHALVKDDFQICEIKEYYKTNETTTPTHSTKETTEVTLNQFS